VPSIKKDLSTNLLQNQNSARTQGMVNKGLLVKMLSNLDHEKTGVVPQDKAFKILRLMGVQLDSVKVEKF